MYTGLFLPDALPQQKGGGGSSAEVGHLPPSTFPLFPSMHLPLQPPVNILNRDRNK